MAKWGDFKFDGLETLQQQLNELEQNHMQVFVNACAKELAARLLAKVIKCTPVGDYPNISGKKGGTLRRGWISKTHEEAQGEGQPAVKAYVDSLKIKHVGNVVAIEIKNPVEYASYVEFGHRTRNGGGQGWVDGKRMLTLSEQEVEKIAPKVLEKKLEVFLKECFGGDS